MSNEPKGGSTLMYFFSFFTEGRWDNDKRARCKVEVSTTAPTN